MKNYIYIILFLFITSISYADTFSERIYGSLVVDTDLTVDTNTLVVDADNNRVGIGTASPSANLDVSGLFQVNASQVTVLNRNLIVSEGKELRFGEAGSSQYVGFKASDVTTSQVWSLPSADGDLGDIIRTDGNGALAIVTPTIMVPVAISMFDAVPSRGTESNWNGGLLELDNAAAVNSGAPFNISTKGSGKILIVVNAGGDLAGDITLTGTSVDRDTMTQTASDTSVITINGTTTDNTTTDANSNVVHKFTKAYISDKWFTGVVQITTADVAITDMDIFHVSFEQFNDQTGITLNTLDVNLFTTNVAAEFDCYLFDLHVTGDECDVENHAELHVGAVGGAKAQTALANEYFRLRQGNINQLLDGSTDGIWLDVHYSNSPVYVEDVTIKVWATCSQPLTLT